MSRHAIIAAFAAPAISLIAIGVSAASSLGLGLPYGEPSEKLEAASAATSAEATFARADIDKSGALDANEYSALAVVTAELARLNGFVAIETGGEPQIVLLPIEAPGALTGGERARVDAVARTNFYAIAGEDSLISRDEYLGDQAARFIEADRNGNGALAKTELVAYAAREALISRIDA
jgi:hypothetical protein